MTISLFFFFPHPCMLTHTHTCMHTHHAEWYACCSIWIWSLSQTPFHTIFRISPCYITCAGGRHGETPGRKHDVIKFRDLFSSTHLMWLPRIRVCVSLTLCDCHALVDYRVCHHEALQAHCFKATLHIVHNGAELDVGGGFSHNWKCGYSDLKSTCPAT
jgi:hypothetical protein